MMPSCCSWDDYPPTSDNIQKSEKGGGVVRWTERCAASWVYVIFWCDSNTLASSLNMQEALAYLGFPPVPSHALPVQRWLCLCCEKMTQPPREELDMLYAARLYGAIADISIKARRTATIPT